MKKLKITNLLSASAFILIGLICVNHFLVLLTNLFNINGLHLVFPVSFLISALLFLYIFRKSENSVKDKSFALIISILIVTISYFISSSFFDFSWDGLWYHQAAIYYLKEGWNPVYDPLHPFDKCEANSVLHFAKGPWYFAASVYSALGNFEAAKCINIIVLVALYFVTYSAAKTYGLKGLKPVVLATLIALNPVIINETLSFLVDQLLISYLLIYLVSIINWLRKKDQANLILSAMAAICLVNTKFTGLVFFIITSFFVLVYITVFEGMALKKLLVQHLLILVLGVFLFGYNPYVTNTINRGHPFYPVMGANEDSDNPGKPKKDPNEVYETPKNMMGKNTLARFFYATFSKPGNAPFNDEADAILMWPFSSGPSGWDVYRFHEARVSGFGPYFSGILILSFVLSIFIILKKNKLRWILIIAGSAILISIFLNRHFWIPRFAPQLWYLPVVPIVIAWLYPLSKKLTYYSYFIAFMVLINGSIVAYQHLKWEHCASNKLREQLIELKEQDKPLNVYCRWFKKAIEERLGQWDIEFGFVEKDRLAKDKNREMQTVVEGYVGTVLYNVSDANEY